MSDEAYRRLAKLLDTLPNGFPSTANGVEIKILRKIFTPEEIDLFCDMRLAFETAEQVAARTGRPMEGLEDSLIAMWRKGQIFGIQLGHTHIFKMVPWIFGIYELQLGRIDRELAELVEEYIPHFSTHFFTQMPQFMQTLPVEDAITTDHEPMPYEKVSAIIEKGQSFLVNECICRQERALIGKPCSASGLTQVCLAIAPVPNVFDNAPSGRVLTKAEAYELIKQCEDEGLVHMTNNFQNGQFFICNCCPCCCGLMRSINELGLPVGQAVNTHYYAVIDPDKCSSCGLCAEERCKVGAISEVGESYRVEPNKCIGCGLCVPTCLTQAVALKPKDKKDIVIPPLDENEWFAERGRNRGVDYSAYK